MSTLRIIQTNLGQHKYKVTVEVEGDGCPRHTATSQFSFTLTDKQQDDLGWYLEDFLQYEIELEAKRGEQIEQQMAEIGTKLFKAVFYSSDDARDLWATLRDHINDTRIEIATEVAEAATIPWELIRNPKTDTALALQASAFVRIHLTAARRPKIPQTPSEIVRILLVTCRTRGQQDEGYRLVADPLKEVLQEKAPNKVQLDELNPPTFDKLTEVLREAKTKGKPYHIVHFDGHGIYAQLKNQETSAETIYKLKPQVLSELRLGMHGYLLFENPRIPENRLLVDGSRLGDLLVETDVPILILNACRSAQAGLSSILGTVAEQLNPISLDPHTQVRAFGSLALEVMDKGVAGVVAMRYNLYVDTAAQFVATLYKWLAQGLTLGEAVTLGRKELSDQPLRRIESRHYHLQDWSVPVVYETAPISLFPQPSDKDQVGKPLDDKDQVGKPPKNDKVGGWRRVFAISLFSTFVVMLAMRPLGMLRSLELAAYDLLMRSLPSESLDKHIVVIGITDPELQEWNQDIKPDLMLKALLEKLQEYKPRVIGLDIYLDQPQGIKPDDLRKYIIKVPEIRKYIDVPDICINESQDINHQCKFDNHNELINKIKNSASTIIACVADNNPAQAGAKPPDEIDDQQLGFSDFVYDDKSNDNSNEIGDEIVRRSLLAMSVEGNPPCDTQYSLSYKLAEKYLEQDQIKPNWDDQGYLYFDDVFFQPLNQNGASGGYPKIDKNWGYDPKGYEILLDHRPQIKHYTYTEFIKNKVQKKNIQDRVVLIGYTSPTKANADDLHATPYGKMPGVSIHAKMVSQIISAAKKERRLISFCEQEIELLWTWLWSLIFGILFLLFQKPLQRVLIVIVTPTLMLIICWCLFDWRSRWIPLIPPLVTFVFVGVGIVTVNYWQNKTKSN